MALPVRHRYNSKHALLAQLHVHIGTCIKPDAHMMYIHQRVSAQGRACGDIACMLWSRALIVCTPRAVSRSSSAGLARNADGIMHGREHTLRVHNLLGWPSHTWPGHVCGIAYDTTQRMVQFCSRRPP